MEEAPQQADYERLIQLFHTGRTEEMRAGAEALVQRFPQNGYAWKLLGVALQAQGAEPIAALRRAAELLPDDAGAQSNLGNAYRDVRRLDAALECYRRAVRISPGFSDGHFNLGNVLYDLERFADAAESYRVALALRPDHADALCNLGNTLDKLGRREAAVDAYRQALAVNPGLVQAGVNLAVTLRHLDRFVESEQALRRVLELAPENVEARHNRSLILAMLSAYDEVVAESDAVLGVTSDAELLWEQRLYAFSYHPDLAAEVIYREFLRWGDRFPEPGGDFSGHDRTPGRRLRVGYVSPDFRSHTSRFYFWPLFANHDRSAIELFAYSNVQREDACTEEFKTLFEHWRDISRLDDREAAAQVRQDGIDILVDCCNHMSHHRLDVFALKPAPVQVTWLGAAWTTGLKAVDYVLFDPFLAPQGTLAREQIVRLPRCFVAYLPPQETAEVVAPPCLTNSGVTYIYSGRTERLNHRAFRVWGEILRAQSDARLILDFPAFADPPTQAYYREVLAGHGIDPARVTLRRSANIFSGLNDADMLLDCFPHSGGTMLFDALWMGLPVLTLAGRPPLGRIGTSLMTNLGLSEWVAYSEAEYVAKALSLSADRVRLAELRAGMRERMLSSPLMDGPGFAREVEAAYRDMFERWARS